jgi:hypothetical protein
MVEAPAELHDRAIFNSAAGGFVSQERFCSMQTRRDFLASLMAMGGIAAAGLPGIVDAANSENHAHDWDWLVGNWDVWHRRLKDRLAGSNEWEEFAGKSAFWRTMGGFGNVDDNIVSLPGGTYRGLSLRTFDPSSGSWAIWWLDARNPTTVDPPVLGRFDKDIATFIGRDTFKSQPILVRFCWNNVHGSQPWWEQAFSADEGKSWEVNWRNYFTRTSPTARSLPRLPDAPKDWGFLVGKWKVKHRRLKQRLVGSKEWQEFGGTLVNWPVLGGHGNVGDNVMEFPDGTVRGIGLRAFDPASGQWSSWWVDSRDPSTLAAPVRGAFANGVGTFIGDDTWQGRSVRTRVQWSQITSRSARWEQASSGDGGATWEVNWVSEFAREPEAS